MNHYSSRDLDTLALTLYGEARNQEDEGVIAVAEVILTRALSQRWPDIIAEVCLQPWQFSCWNENDPNRKYLERVGPGDPVYDRMERIARDVLDNGGYGLTKGANHYMTVGLYAELMDTQPSHWAHYMERVTTIGDHVYLYDK